MANSKRELLATHKFGSQFVGCKCGGCNWKVSVKPTEEEAQKAFDSHRCEDFKKVVKT